MKKFSVFLLIFFSASNNLYSGRRKAQFLTRNLSPERRAELASHLHFSKRNELSKEDLLRNSEIFYVNPLHSFDSQCSTIPVSSNNTSTKKSSNFFPQVITTFMIFAGMTPK